MSEQQAEQPPAPYDPTQPVPANQKRKVLVEYTKIYQACLKGDIETVAQAIQDPSFLTNYNYGIVSPHDFMRSDKNSKR